jgi:hypothetical protein
VGPLLPWRSTSATFRMLWVWNPAASLRRLCRRKGGPVAGGCALQAVATSWRDGGASCRKPRKHEQPTRK